MILNEAETNYRNLCYDSRLLPSEIECVIYLLISTCITQVVYSINCIQIKVSDNFKSINLIAYNVSTWNKFTGFPTIIIIYNSASVVILYRIRLKHIFFNISEYIHILCTHFATHWNIYYRHYNVYMYDVRYNDVGVAFFACCSLAFNFILS